MNMNNSPLQGLAPIPPPATLAQPSRQLVVAAGSVLPETSTVRKTAPATTSAAAPSQVVTPAAKATPSADELKAMVADIQRKIASVTPELQFSVDQQSGQAIVTMMDSNTKEVLWQFPSDQVLQVRKELDQYQRGTLVHRKA